MLAQYFYSLQPSEYKCLRDSINVPEIMTISASPGTKISPISICIALAPLRNMIAHSINYIETFSQLTRSSRFEQAAKSGPSRPLQLRLELVNGLSGHLNRLRKGSIGQRSVSRCNLLHSGTYNDFYGNQLGEHRP